MIGAPLTIPRIDRLLMVGAVSAFNCSRCLLMIGEPLTRLRHERILMRSVLFTLFRTTLTVLPSRTQTNTKTAGR